MKNLATYHDQNRLIHESGRRLHAADMELSGGYVQVVPAVAKKLAPLVQERALAWSEGQAIQLEALQEERDEVRRIRRERWWIGEWRRKDGLYRLKRLTSEEKSLTRVLLGQDGLPTEAFPRAQGRLADDNDAQMVAEVMACGGRMIITSNRVLIEKDVLDDWLARKQNEWPGLSAEKLLSDVDPLYTGWWKSHPLGPKMMTRIVLAAYWPREKKANSEEVLEAARQGAQALQRGHLKRFAGVVLERLEDENTVREEVAEARGAIAERMREAERRREAILDEGESTRGTRLDADPGKDVMNRFEWEQ